jgi:hypothetical protein
LKGSFADSLLGDGVWRCIENLDRTDAAGQASAKWLTFAVAAVQEHGDANVGDGPIWLSWLGGAVEAIGLWRRCAAEHPAQCSNEALLAGTEFIRNGLPALALSYWKRLSRAARHRARRGRILQQRVAMILKEAQQHAEVFGVAAYRLDSSDAGAALDAVARWYVELRDTAVLDHVWRSHLEYLLRFNKIDPQPGVRALIRTAQKRSPVTFATLQKLVLVNRNRAEKLLHGARSFT